MSNCLKHNAFMFISFNCFFTAVSFKFTDLCVNLSYSTSGHADISLYFSNSACLRGFHEGHTLFHRSDTQQELPPLVFYPVRQQVSHMLLFTYILVSSSARCIVGYMHVKHCCLLTVFSQRVLTASHCCPVTISNALHCGKNYRKPFRSSETCVIYN